MLGDHGEHATENRMLGKCLGRSHGLSKGDVGPRRYGLVHFGSYTESCKSNRHGHSNCWLAGNEGMRALYSVYIREGIM